MAKSGFLECERMSEFLFLAAASGFCVQNDRKILHKVCWTVQGMALFFGVLTAFLHVQKQGEFLFLRERVLCAMLAALRVCP